jgi:hypothetical protein
MWMPRQGWPSRPPRLRLASATCSGHRVHGRGGAFGRGRRTPAPPPERQGTSPSPTPPGTRSSIVAASQSPAKGTIRRGGTPPSTGNLGARAGHCARSSSLARCHSLPSRHGIPAHHPTPYGTQARRSHPVASPTIASPSHHIPVGAPPCRPGLWPPTPCPARQQPVSLPLSHLSRSSIPRPHRPTPQPS